MSALPPSDHRHRRLLRTRFERPCCSRTADERDALQQKGPLFDQLVGARVQDEKEADRSTLRRYSIGGDDDVIE